LCQPSGASSKSGALGPLFSHASISNAIGTKNWALVDTISQMVTIGVAPGVSWRPDLNCRHSLADGVYNLLGNTLGLFRARASLFELSVKIRKRLAFRGGRLAGRNWRTTTTLPLTLFRRCHVVMVAEVGGTAKKIRIARLIRSFSQTPTAPTRLPDRPSDCAHR
jgi:hypothetical protein